MFLELQEESQDPRSRDKRKDREGEAFVGG